jgi:hypothetical protein
LVWQTTHAQEQCAAQSNTSRRTPRVHHPKKVYDPRSKEKAYKLRNNTPQTKNRKFSFVGRKKAVLVPVVAAVQGVLAPNLRML